MAVGGLENGLVNLINHIPYDRYRHSIICLTGSTEYSARIKRKDVKVIALNKRKGHDFPVHGRFVKVLRSLKPDIVHTRNLPALEFQLSAALAGVSCRIHGEHGRDIYDLDGTNSKYNALRKTMRLFTHQYIAVSRNLSQWLTDIVKVSPARIAQIYNGVDTERFHPRASAPPALGGGFVGNSDVFVVGTVGRMETIKDPLTLVRAFVHLLRKYPSLGRHLRLVVVGDGALRAPALQMLHGAHAEKLAWLPGERKDIPDIMRAMDLFVLPSLREGISNTILEAMSTGLPVVATAVGGNPELVLDDLTGTLVPPSDPVSMASAIRGYLLDRGKAKAHGVAGRRRVEACFSMQSMVAGYLRVYDSVLFGKGHCPETLANELSAHGADA